MKSILVMIGTPMVAVHEHNERKVADQLLDSIERGESIAVISDRRFRIVSDSMSL